MSLLPGVPPVVRRAGRHVEALSGPCDPLATVDAEANSPPRTTVKCSSMAGWTCSPVTAPPGLMYPSIASSSPPEPSVPTRTTTRSPVTGFSITSPALDISSSFSPVEGHTLLPDLRSAQRRSVLPLTPPPQFFRSRRVMNQLGMTPRTSSPPTTSKPNLS